MRKPKIFRVGELNTGDRFKIIGHGGKIHTALKVENTEPFISNINGNKQSYLVKIAVNSSHVGCFLLAPQTIIKIVVTTKNI